MPDEDTPTSNVSFKKDIQELLERARKLGLEGWIGKRADSQYEAGKRTGAWIKLKLHQEQECVIGGYTEPEGSRKYFGALLVGFYEARNLNLLAELEAAPAISTMLIFTLQSLTILLSEKPFNRTQYSGGRLLAG